MLTSRELGLQLSNLSKTIRLSENFFSCSRPDVKTKYSRMDNIENSALLLKGEEHQVENRLEKER